MNQTHTRSYLIGLNESQSKIVANGTISGKSFKLNGKGAVATKDRSCEEKSILVFTQR